MNKSQANSSGLRVGFWLGFLMLVIAGIIFLAEAFEGQSHGLRPWLLPFAPWSVALTILFSEINHRKILNNRENESGE